MNEMELNTLMPFKINSINPEEFQEDLIQRILDYGKGFSLEEIKAHKIFNTNYIK